MKKVSVIGAGNVGGTTAMRIAESGLAQVALIDIVENMTKAKALDIEDARYALKYNTNIKGTNDFSALVDSDIVVMTAGFPRKPGMTREDLLSKNAAIMTDVCGHITRYAKDAIVIIVSNPLDAMTYLAFKKTGIPKKKIFGMGVNLDASRFANLIAKKLAVEIEKIRALVIGSHGETMLPLPRATKVGHKFLADLLSEAEVASLVEATKKRGAEIVSLYGSGSAYYSPSAAIFEIVKTILSGRAKEIPVSAVLDGEYGCREVSIGVLTKIGSSGIEKIIEIDLTASEKQAFQQSAQAIKESIKFLNV